MNQNISEIKLFGERNSGTTYTLNLLRQNIDKSIMVHSGKYNSKSGWKHGIPDPSKINKQKTLVLFIIRDLVSWLNSMYFRPYHIKKQSNFIRFITEKIIPREKRLDHPVNLYSDERKNLFQLRYKKLKKYLFFFENHNCVLLNLNFVQQQPEEMLDLIKKHFNVKINEKFLPVLKHTKTKEFIQNDLSHQKYKIPSEIYQKYANHNLETKVNNLTYKINKI
jgi:hypothetical protein